MVVHAAEAAGLAHAQVAKIAVEAEALTTQKQLAAVAALRAAADAWLPRLLSVPFSSFQFLYPTFNITFLHSCGRPVRLGLSLGSRSFEPWNLEPFLLRTGPRCFRKVLILQRKSQQPLASKVKVKKFW